MMRVLAAIGVCAILLGTAMPTMAKGGSGRSGTGGGGRARLHVGHGNGSKYYCQPGVCNAP
jgi:hypothetical protein